MTSALTLLAYGFLAAYGFGPALVGATWTARAPRLAIVAWHLLSVTTVLALLLAGLMLSTSVPYIGTAVASVVDLCTRTLQHLYAAPDRHTASLAAVLLLLLLLPVRLGYVSWRVGARARRYTKRMRDLIEPVARSAAGCGDALVIEHTESYAFCLPGRGARVVVTSALLEGLSETQLQAVLAHEGAHVRQRHHLALMIPKVLAEAFGAVVPVFATAESEVARLVELSADDAARRSVGGEALGGALRLMSRNADPGPALAASAVAVEERLRRLDVPPGELSRRQAVAVGTAMTIVAIAPFLFAVAPVVTSAGHELCLIG